MVKDTTSANKAFNALTDTISASAGYADDWDDFGTNLAVNGIANNIGLHAEQLPMWRAFGSTVGKLTSNYGRKFVKQGINYLSDKLKNTFYNSDDNDR